MGRSTVRSVGNLIPAASANGALYGAWLAMFDLARITGALVDNGLLCAHRALRGSMVVRTNGEVS